VVNLDVLDKHFKDGEVVNPANLISKKIIRGVKGKVPAVKILGNGNISKKLILENCKVSKTAREAIEKAGGSVKSQITNYKSQTIPKS